jgi:Metal-independent restriction enzyme BfiI DNA binding domain
MIEFALHPQVYATGPSRGLVNMLERAWIRDHRPGDGHMVVVSGFGNYNGGVRFYDVFRRHISEGGKATAVFAGSTSQRLTSRQVVGELLDCGVDVHVVSRKRLLHTKCYGLESSAGNQLVVSSGNFTGPGMSQNVEGSVYLDVEATKGVSFRWGDALNAVFAQRWQFHRPSLRDRDAPAWKLLYNEFEQDVRLDETEDVTMLMTLSHADTARIQAEPGTDAGLGSQYFWLSKDCYGFFPPLVLLNTRGIKRTYSCLIKLRYVDLGETDDECRVTFEAENNVDFRLGTGRLRYTKLAAQGDLAAITRTGYDTYDLRIYLKNTPQCAELLPYAVTFIGQQGKRYGFMPNEEFFALIAASVEAI